MHTTVGGWDSSMDKPDAHLKEMNPSSDRFHLLIFSATSMLFAAVGMHRRRAATAPATPARKPAPAAADAAAGEEEREEARDRAGDRLGWLRKVAEREWLTETQVARHLAQQQQQQQHDQQQLTPTASYYLLTISYVTLASRVY